MHWLEPPFNMIVTGRTGSGKTHFILDVLERDFKGKFKDIVIFCPTINFNRTYQDRSQFLKNRHIHIAPPELVKEDLDGVIEESINALKGSSQTLFLIDDCANLKRSKVKNSMLCQLAFSGRHHNISTWILTQKYNAIVKDFRDNIRHLVMHYEKDRDSLKSALNENRVIPLEDHPHVITQLDQGKRLFLRIDVPLSYVLF